MQKHIFLTCKVVESYLHYKVFIRIRNNISEYEVGCLAYRRSSDNDILFVLFSFIIDPMKMRAQWDLNWHLAM